MAFINKLRLSQTGRKCVLQVAQNFRAASSAATKHNRVQKKSPLPRHVGNPYHSYVEILGVAATIQLLSKFEWPNSISTPTTAYNVCSHIVDAGMVVPRKRPRARNGTQNITYDRNREFMDKRVRKWRETGIVPEDLLELIHNVKKGGLVPTREMYTEALKIAMCVSGSEGTTQHPASVVDLLKLICEDHGKAAGLEAMYSGAFFIASDETQLDKIWERLNEIGVDFSKGDSQQLLESYITALCQGRARSAVTSFMRRVVPNSSSPNVFTFERLLENCSRSNQLSRGINTFTCMTRTYGIAPTRNAFNSITSLLARHTENDVVTVQLCYRILCDTEAIYDRDPPLWVYPRVAMSLVQLQAGVQGYEHMMNLTKHRAYQRIQQHQPYYYPQANPHVATQRLVQQAWNAKVFYHLLGCANATKNTDLTVHLICEMKSLGIPITSEAYILMLQAVHKHEDLDKCLTILLQEAQVITEAADWLLTPLHHALERVLSGHSVGMQYSAFNGESIKDLLLVSAHQQIKVALSGTSHRYCLDHIASLGRREAVRTDSNVVLPHSVNEVKQEVAL